ncbi:MAG: ABC transporter substrate-binding protein [Planctomycetota bacterium]|jgi:ribose transport system substrate-binding protein|nr:ABC transporter substrate-binding protein [Planctomycetota bacterium]
MKRIIAALLLAAFGLCASEARAAADPADVAVIIKATDSDFWQYVLVGARNYAKEFPDKVSITTYGPRSEADIDRQVTILEDVISTKPDAIVISSTSSDATVPALEDAKEQGIVVVTIDNRVNTDRVDSLLATNNLAAGELAAKTFVDLLKAKGVQPSGKVGIISAMAGVQVLTDRDDGFVNGVKKYAPGIQLLGPRFCDNDIVRALNNAIDMYTANPDLLGFFADNNHTGDGVARAIAELNLSDKLIGIAFDSDPEEIQAVRDGALKALVLQDPYGMGYYGVDSALKKLAGQDIPAYVDTGVTIVTRENMDHPDILGLLDPMTRAVD